MEIKPPLGPKPGPQTKPNTGTPSPKTKAPGSGQKVPTWVLLWGAILMFVLVIFLANKGAMDEALKSTGFLQTTSQGKNPQVLRQTPPQGSVPQVQAQGSLPPGPGDPALAPLLENPAPTEEKPQTATPETSNPAAGPKRQALLYFVDIQNESQILLISTKRDIPATEAPLTMALKTLLQGPSEEELSQKGLVSLIPTQTHLLSVRVTDETAILNFSEEFQFNSLGLEGFEAQLKQVVYTATEFPNVTRVQILIAGQKKNYLGPDGVFIGEPLTRQSF